MVKLVIVILAALIHPINVIAMDIASPQDLSASQPSIATSVTAVYPSDDETFSIAEVSAPSPATIIGIPIS